LRLVCPAILGPSLFGLMPEHPEKKPARVLTLLAKVVQQLANLVEFGEKEPYMKEFNTFCTDNFDKMRKFIDNISNFDENCASDEQPVNINIEKEFARIAQHVVNCRELIIQDPKWSERLPPVLDAIMEAKRATLTSSEPNESNVYQ